MTRLAAGLSLGLMLVAAGPAVAQDEGLDSLLFVRSVDSSQESQKIDANTVQLNRIPLSVPLRLMGEKQWGLRLTFPVSMSSVRVKLDTTVGRILESLGVLSIVPGIELQIPITPALRLRPFAEVGIGKGTGSGDTEALYGVGLSARHTQSAGPLHVMLGAKAMRRKRAESTGRYDAHSTFEAAIDVQVPLGFSMGDRLPRVGMYSIARAFDGLELEREGYPPLVLRRQLEAGVSMATSPDLRIWRLTLPWLAAGYQFGDTFSGVRLYLSFPF